LAYGFNSVFFLFSGCSGTRPPNLEVKDNRLSPCPSSPNCVSSQGEDEGHRIGPIRFTSTPAVHTVVYAAQRNTDPCRAGSALIFDRGTYLSLRGMMRLVARGSLPEIAAGFFLNTAQRVTNNPGTAPLRSTSSVLCPPESNPSRGFLQLVTSPKDFDL
jgi:hypothetical protein